MLLKRVVAALFTLTLAAGSWAQEVLSPMQFTQYYRDIISQTYPELEFRITAELELSAKLGEEDMALYLSNAYTDYQASPEELENVVARYGRAISAQIQAQDDAPVATQIVPVIKDVGYLEQVQTLMQEAQKDGKPKSSLVQIPLNAELFVLFVFDSEYSMRFVTEEDVQELGLAKSELIGLGLENLFNVVPGLSGEGDASRLSYLVADSNYEASFILLDELWTKENFPVMGEIVIAVPSRDAVLITGSDDKESLQAIRQIIDENEFSHAISERFFIRLDGGWALFSP